MLLWNVRDDLRNGTSGTFLDQAGEHLIDDFPKIGKIDLKRETWNKRLTSGRLVGSRKQCPVVAMYAITCHKCQGLTLPAAVNWVNTFCFLHGNRMLKLQNLPDSKSCMKFHLVRHSFLVYNSFRSSWSQSFQSRQHVLTPFKNGVNVYISCFKTRSARNFFCVWMVSSSGWNSTLFCFLFLFIIPSDAVEADLFKVDNMLNGVMFTSVVSELGKREIFLLRLDGFLQRFVHWPNENKEADLAGR